MAQLLDPPAMAPTAKRRGEEGFDAGFSHFNADESRTHGNNVGIVMVSRELC